MKNTAGVAHAVTPLLGVGTGLRSFTPLVVAAWFAHSGKLPLKGTWAAGIAHPAAVAVLTTAAVAEGIADKLPNAPDRTLPVALVGRIILGGLAGAIVATALRRPVASCVALGVLGAVAGTYGGFHARRALTESAGIEDLAVALCEDATAVTMAIRSLSRITA